MKALQCDKLRAHILFYSFSKDFPGKRKTKLGAGMARQNIPVGVSIHSGSHPQEDIHFFARLPGCFFYSFKLRRTVRHNTAHPCLSRIAELFVRLAVAVKENPLHGEVGRQGSMELSP